MIDIKAPTTSPTAFPTASPSSSSIAALETARQYTFDHTKEIPMTINPSFLHFQQNMLRNAGGKLIPIDPVVNHNFYKLNKGSAIINAAHQDLCQVKHNDERIIKGDQRFLAYYCKEV